MTDIDQIRLEAHQPKSSYIMSTVPYALTGGLLGGLLSKGKMLPTLASSMIGTVAGLGKKFYDDNEIDQARRMIRMEKPINNTLDVLSEDMYIIKDRQSNRPVMQGLLDNLNKS